MPHNKRQFTYAEEAVLTTLLYSDIFHFPLTQDELWHFLISMHPLSKTAFEQALDSLQQSDPVICFHEGYYCLVSREAIVHKRIKNLQVVRKKLVLARQIIPKIALLPTVLFIGISGGLAAAQATKEDDIDLFIIVRKNTLFFSRFVILVLLQLLGHRRVRGMKKAPDKVCVNFLIDETQLVWKQRDLYTAREITQVIPMFTCGSLYETFLEKNRWIAQFLPNSLAEKQKPFLRKKAEKRTFLPPFIEKLLRFIQISYMRKVHTTEVITNHYLAFHPDNYRLKTLHKLRLKMESLDLLTKF